MRLAGRRAARSIDFSAELPPGLPTARVNVRISIPALPPSPPYQFTEHPLDEDGRAGTEVLAVTQGGFAISPDLGESWRPVRPKGYTKHEFLHVKSLGQSEYLAQAVLPKWKWSDRLVDILVLDANGAVLAENRINASPWHGCRSVDLQDGTLMFAEYPYDIVDERPQNREPRRVFRSRDRGRSWEVVLEQPGTNLRHFHFLQARPNRSGEWWLTSGDRPNESRIWLSKDAGDTWEEISERSPEQIGIDGQAYPRSIFRLTDIAWRDDTILWATDQFFPAKRHRPRGALVLESHAGELLVPRLIGTALWPVRNIVDVGEYFLLLSQGPLNFAAIGDERRPNVYLLPKEYSETRPLMHLFNVEAYSSAPTGFTYSRASRAARDGVFFTYRSGTDVFPFGHKLLKWEVSFS